MADQSPDQAQLFDLHPAPWEADDQSQRTVAEVVLTEGPRDPLSYGVPEELVEAVLPGKRVRVPLGKSNRLLAGYCVGVALESTRGRRLKDVRSVLDPRPLLDDSLLRLTRWMSEHYLCGWAQTLEAVLPAGVRHEAGTKLESFLRVDPHVAAQLATLELPRKQMEALRILAATPGTLTFPQLARAAGCTLSPLKELQKKGLIRVERKRVQITSDQREPVPRSIPPELTPDQQQALTEILACLERPGDGGGSTQSILLHGVTGSGKTEVYIRAIEETLTYGRQAIVLVPEISLTPQTCERFRQRFSRVAVLHSHLSPSERHWHWRQIASGQVEVVVGARSAVFAPTPHLGLIILDEEHDASFKQDTIPRYHARDVAAERARLAGVPLILGSATPSLESWQAAKTGRHRLVSMPNRVENRPLPPVVNVDLRNENRSRRMGGAISHSLHETVSRALDQRGQVILLLNRRGFATQVQCPACGHVFRCEYCDIPLTYHRQDARAVCHYCDYDIAAPRQCGECGFSSVRFTGVGTERLEAEVRSRFPDARVLRMDSDTMRRPGSHEQALSKFRRGDVDILLGTQMIAKGLDFPNVMVVGVINADSALHFPDFRATERTFQLVTQVAGRTGRGARHGRVLVQTFNPTHPAIEAAAAHDYLRFARDELAHRRAFGYPPFGRMIRLVARGPDETRTRQFMEGLAQRVAAELEARDVPVRLLGPSEAPISKLRDRYRFHLLLLAAELPPLQAAVRAVADIPCPDETQWIADVDPLDML